MSNLNESRRGEYLTRYGIIAVGTATERFWSHSYETFVVNHKISDLWSYQIPLAVVSAILIGPDIFRLARGLLVSASKRFKFSELVEHVAAAVRYKGSPLFFLDARDQNLLEVCYERAGARFQANVARVMFQEFPVIYYNVTAKPFLNWIDYLYLLLLQRLRKAIGARVVVALHFDELVYREGYFTDVVRKRYAELFRRAEQVVKAVVGEEATVLDERWFLAKGTRGASRFVEYFFGILMAKINGLALGLEKGEISFNDFYRAETNLISILSTIIVARRYAHLFVLDYEGSFSIWEQSPFTELKNRRRIFFVKCSKLKGPNEERLPSWSEGDGVNITDDTHTMHQKILALDAVSASAMQDVFSVGTTGMTDAEGREALFRRLRSIKEEANL